MTDLFIIASRKKYRFPSIRSDLTVEQLWDLPLLSYNGFDLNASAVAVNAELKGLAEESFVETRSNPRRGELENMLEIIKFVIATNQEEATKATQRAAKASLKAQIQEAIEAKKLDQLSSASLEDLQAQLASLGE